MINKIKVLKNRELLLLTNKLGITSEHNAEILQFEFPDKLNGIPIESCTKKVKLTNEDGTLEAEIFKDNTVKIDSSWTTRPSGILWVEIDTPTSAKDKMHWLSYPYPVEFKTKPVEGDNPNADNASVDELRETLTLAMGDRILSEYHGGEIFPNFSESTYEQLLQFILNLRGFVAKAVGYLNGADDVNEETYIGDSLAQIYDFTPKMIETLKMSIIEEYCKANDITLDKREQWLLVGELDEAYPLGEIKSIDSLALWSAPLYIRTANKARAELTQYMAEDINRAFNEEILSESATFDDNIGAIADKVNNTINTIRLTMYDDNSDNITYTEAVNRIDEVRTDFVSAVNGSDGDTYPMLIDKAKSYADNASYMDSIIASIENATYLPLTTLGQVANTTEALLRYPYFDTIRATSISTSVWITTIEEIGFDMTNIVISGSTNAFTNVRVDSTYIVTGLDRATIATKTKTRGLFLNSKFKYLYTDKISMPSDGDGWDNTFREMFSGCVNLQKIGKFDKTTRKIIEDEYALIDFTNALNVDSMFGYCGNLVEVRFVPGSLVLSLDLSPCAKLSKESAISAINACGTVSGKTLKLSKANSNVQITDPDIASAVAIATEKGFTVSYG